MSRKLNLTLTTFTALSLAACANMPNNDSQSLALGDDPIKACAALMGNIPYMSVGSPSGVASISSTTWMRATNLAVAERGPTPAARISPETPAFCRVLGSIAPVDPQAPLIKFQINLPALWNGRSVQYGGGGFNGVLIDAQGLIPAGRFDRATPLAQGFVTVGTDSGHQNQAGQPPQSFALNEEALVNFAHASYPKVRNVSAALMQRAYGQAPAKLYFVGSSEGGREGLTMAQRYPDAFDGIFSRVPVIHWTALQHVGLRDGMATMGEGWIRPAQIKLVHEAVLATCDGLDGLKDGVIANPDACKTAFDVTKLRCVSGTANATNDSCLNDAQVKAVQTLGSAFNFSFNLANGLRQYPGRGPSGEGLPSFAATGGWGAWWLGAESPAIPPVPRNSIGWIYGAGAIQYFYARDPKSDLRNYKPENHLAQVQKISALMDSTNPDLFAFKARGGKLLMLENMADYAQSPYAGIQYFESVKTKMGDVSSFYKLYTAPNVDHVGSGAPANVDMLTTLTQWVERGVEPKNLQLVEQGFTPPFVPLRSRPMCEWSAYPRYISGDVNLASSFECSK